jgi:hypothetical protein
VTAPAVWSILVELTAREVLGQWRATHAPLADRIPARLWLTAPVESARTWLRLARRLDGEQAAARLDVGVHAAAVEALKLALPQRRARRVRRILQRQLRAGSLPPSAVLGPLGWLDGTDALAEVTPRAVLMAALRSTLDTSTPPSTLDTSTLDASTPGQQVDEQALAGAPVAHPAAPPQANTAATVDEQALADAPVVHPAVQLAPFTVHPPVHPPTRANGREAPLGSLAVLDRPSTPTGQDAETDIWTRYDRDSASGHPWTWRELGAQLGIKPDAARKRAGRRPSTHGPSGADDDPDASTPDADHSHP